MPGNGLYDCRPYGGDIPVMYSAGKGTARTDLSFAGIGLITCAVVIRTTTTTTKSGFLGSIELRAAGQMLRPFYNQ